MAPSPSHSQTTITFVGVELTAARVEAALERSTPGRIYTHSVLVNGRRFPLSQALEVASGISRTRFSADRAREVFGALGFELHDADLGTTSAAATQLGSREPAARPAVAAERSVGRLWAVMDSQRPHLVSELALSNVPTLPGVYAFYRDYAAVYVGRAVTATGLRSRLRTHTATGVDLSHSSFRRNVAEHLEVAPTSVTRRRPPVLAAREVEPVNAWIRTCEVRWQTATSIDEAKQLENSMKAEWKPPLTKR